MLHCLQCLQCLPILVFSAAPNCGHFARTTAGWEGTLTIAFQALRLIPVRLGHGLGIGAGMALAAKMDNKNYATFVLLGDGECYEGSVWEAFLFAGHHRLNNLVAIVDRNQQCVLDFTEDCVHLEPLDLKLKAFGWDVETVDGHSFEALLRVFASVRECSLEKPLAVILPTPSKAKGFPSGLDSLVSAVLEKNGWGGRLKRMGFSDSYDFRFGSREFLYGLNGFDNGEIIRTIKKLGENITD